MEEAQQLSPEEFKEVVDVFKVLRKWRDDRNARLMTEEPAEENGNERSVNASEHQFA